MDFNEPVRESIYLSAIGRCHEIVEKISSKVSVIKDNGGLAQEKTDTPARTLLERELANLIAHLTDLEKSIIV